MDSKALFDFGVAMSKRKARVVHCWEEGPREPDLSGTTCMLEDGHDGPHDFVRDSEIMIRFKPERSHPIMKEK